MCQGLPGSGKSTWADSQVEAGEGHIIKVEMDVIRGIRGIDHSKGFDPESEKLVFSDRNSMIRHALSRGKTVISSDLNITPVHEAFYRKLCDEFGATFEIKVFDTPIEECIRRDSLRSGNKKVGQEVIESWQERWKGGKK